MQKNDPAMGPTQGNEKIVQLSSPRRAAAATRAPRPQPAAVVPFDQWVALRDRAAATLLAGGKRLWLTGVPGTGKTVLLEHLARVLRAAGRIVTVQLADADPAPPGIGSTLIVDEADRLSEAKRHHLETGAGTLVLAGLGSMVPRRLPAGTVHLTLVPLAQAESRAYVAQWLSLNGHKPLLLDEKAVRRLMELSDGVPRLLSSLLASSVWLAKASGAATVEARHVQEAAELRSVLGAPPPPSRTVARAGPGRAIWSATLALAVIAAMAAAVVPRLSPAATEQTLMRARAAADWVRARIWHAPIEAMSARPPPSQPAAPITRPAASTGEREPR